MRVVLTQIVGERLFNLMVTGASHWEVAEDESLIIFNDEETPIAQFKNIVSVAFEDNLVPIEV